MRISRYATEIYVARWLHNPATQRATKEELMRATCTLLTLMTAAIVSATACASPTGIGVFSSSDSTTNRGSIGGVVTADGAPRGGVLVIAIASQRDSALTDGTGSYRITGLTTGQYTVSVVVPVGLQLAPGQAGSSSVTVGTNAVATANFALQSTP